MTQPHETDALSAFQHVNAIIEHSRPDILSHVLVNTGLVPGHALKKYARENSHPVDPDTARIRSLGYEVIEDNIVTCAETVRHNPRRAARRIIEMIQTSKKRSHEDRRRKKAIYAGAH